MKDSFVCLDCETTGLDPKTDRIIEVACKLFTFEKVTEEYETLVDPQLPIPEESQAIHHISDDMVIGQPTIKEVLPDFLKRIKGRIIVGHGIEYDMKIIAEEAKRHSIPCTILDQPFLDTLRLARLYGECRVNSLEKLREHFNIPEEIAHRAMSDVTVNIEVFKHLSKQFRTTKQMFERLKKPIALRLMPLGKHKGRPFKELPLEYLQWASHQNFDMDLLFSLRSEIKRRRSGTSFAENSSPFAGL
ncbi:MAG: DUF3820 family protein [Simkaniaceae bacterium]|nr:DUF3820 family protein [Simkaniaceae bacterium]